MQPLDVILVPCGDVEVDVSFIELLSRSKRPIERIFVVGTLDVDVRLITRLDDLHLRWENITGSNPTQGVSRALLLVKHDALVISGGFLPFASTIRALSAALEEEDRAAAIVPFVDELDMSDEELDGFIARSALPGRERIPVQNVNVLLLRRVVLDMVAGIDERFDGLADALADYLLRAQRLGFETFRDPAAWVKTTRASKGNDFPASVSLVQRHAYFANQRHVASQSVVAAAVHRMHEAARGPMRVGLDLRYLPEGAINGTSVYAVELIKTLTSNTDIELSACVNTPEQREALSRLGIPVEVGNFAPRVQLVHRPAQVFRPQDASLLLRTPAPYVISFQDLISYRAGSVHGGDGSDQLRYQLTSKVVVKSAQGLIAISHHNKREVMREFGVEEDLINVVHHGVDAAAFARVPGEEDAEAERLMPFDLPQRYFLFIGSDYAHKNVQQLLSAYAAFRALVPVGEAKPGLVLVGHPSGTQHALFPRLRQNPAAGVHYLGGVSHEVLRALYHRAIAFTYLSAYEGFGLPLLEAMAAGTPVLCTRFTSVPEVVGEASLSLDDMSDANIADQLLRLSSDRALRDTLVAAGLERVKLFTWKKTAEATVAAYAQVLQKPSVKSFGDRAWLSELVHHHLW